MTRYWQHKDGAIMFGGPIGAEPTDPDWREVQIAPIDAIVIRREGLATVERHGHVGLDYRLTNPDGSTDGIYSDEATVEGAMGAARAWLAIAEFLRNEPEDPRVQSLADALADGNPTTESDIATARRLVESGVVRVEVRS